MGLGIVKHIGPSFVITAFRSDDEAERTRKAEAIRVANALKKAERNLREYGPEHPLAVEAEKCVSDGGKVDYRRVVRFLDQIKASLQEQGVALFTRGMICFSGLSFLI